MPGTGSVSRSVCRFVNPNATLSMTALITCRGVSKTYRAGTPAVLNAIDFTVGAGELVAIVGKSGSGKSTLLNLLGGMDQTTSGSLIVAGCDMSTAPERVRTEFRRRHLGFVFQNFNLVPVINVRQNLSLPLALNGRPDDGRIESLLMRLGLGEYGERMPDELSGGEQQRVAIARALIHEPKVCLADEPTGNLDAATSAEVITLLRDCVRERGVTLVMATHSTDAALAADRVLSLRDGRLAE